MLKLMNFFNFLLGSGDVGKDNLTVDGNDGLTAIFEKIYGVVNSLIVPIITLVATVGIVYAIVLGVNYAKAETSDAKEEAKKRIINVVVGMVLMIVLILLLWLFIKYAPDLFGWAKSTADASIRNLSIK